MKQIRKIISIQDYSIELGGQVVPCKDILMAACYGETSRTFKAERIVAISYTGSRQHKGVEACYFDKPKSLSKKTLSLEGMIDQRSIDRLTTAARRDSQLKYCTTLKNLKGTVLFFDKRSGEGMVEIPSLNEATFPVYACNLEGRKTWYAETACVYLERDQEVIVDQLFEVGSGLTPRISQGVMFDAEKWASLDKSKLAFRVGDDGELENGLFS